MYPGQSWWGPPQGIKKGRVPPGILGRHGTPGSTTTTPRVPQPEGPKVDTVENNIVKDVRTHPYDSMYPDTKKVWKPVELDYGDYTDYEDYPDQAVEAVEEVEDVKGDEGDKGYFESMQKQYERMGKDFASWYSKVLKSDHPHDALATTTPTRSSTTTITLTPSPPPPPTFPTVFDNALRELSGTLTPDDNVESTYPENIMSNSVNESWYLLGPRRNGSDAGYSGPDNYNVHGSGYGDDYSDSDCYSPLLLTSQWVYLYGLALLLGLALLFNAIMFAIFRAKSLRRYGFSFYLLTSAVTDTMALLCHMPRRWLDMLYGALGWGTGVTIYDTDDIACKSFTYLSHAMRFASAWLVVVLVAERLTMTLNAHKLSKLKLTTPSQQLRVFATVLIFSLGVNCHVLFTWKVVSESDDASSPVLHTGNSSTEAHDHPLITHACAPVFKSEDLATALSVGSIAGMIVLPCIIIIAMVIFTCRNIDKWSMHKRRMSSNIICRLLQERRGTLMVTGLGMGFCFLSMPHLVVWVLLLLQHFGAIGGATAMCDYMRTAAIADMTEVVFLSNNALKLLICLCTGKKVIRH